MDYHAFTSKYDCITNKLCSDVEIGANGQIYKTLGLWDTGATRSCISEEVVKALGLIPTGKVMIATPSGRKDVNTYLIDVGLPNAVNISRIAVCDSDIGKQGLGMLIGMDIISFGDFAVTTKDGETMFSYVIPSIGKIDFVPKSISLNRMNPKHRP